MEFENLYTVKNAYFCDKTKTKGYLISYSRKDLKSESLALQTFLMSKPLLHIQSKYFLKDLPFL
jgi:hypothetical protein